MKKMNFYKRASILLAISFLLLIVSPSFLEAQTLVWEVTSNPSSWHDFAYSMTADNDYLYIVGHDFSLSGVDGQWRIEKRRKSDGGTEWAKTFNPSSQHGDVPYSITADDDYIYIAGQHIFPGPIYSQWRIEKRRKSDGGIEWTKTSDPSAFNDVPYSITADNTYIYIAGYDNALGSADSQWRIEKRRKSDGGIEWIVTSNPSSIVEHARSITADDDYIYIAGYDGVTSDYQWRIEKRRKSDGGIEWTKTSDPSSGNDGAWSITADNTYIYIAGYDDSPSNAQWRIEKRRKSDGGIEWTETSNPSSGDEYIYSITADNTSIYIAGYDAALPSYQWRTEKRRKSDGGIEWIVTSDPSVGRDHARSITADDDYVYIAGFDIANVGGYQWRIQKWTKGVSFIDIGLRVFNGTEIVSIAAEPLGTLTSPLRIAKNGNIYGIALVDPGDPNDSGVRIQTSSGIKALRKYP